MSLAAGEAGSLWHALALVPDNRRAEGKRYPLASLLLIAVAAFLSGRRDQLGIVRWGRRLTREALASIGISRARVPAPSVWCELFKGLDVSALERVLGNWVRGEQAAGHVAIDGKRLRGSATAQSAGVHLLAAFSASLQGVIGQLAVAPDCNEITGALQLLKTLPLDGVIITGDAIFTQREICRVIIDVTDPKYAFAGGTYDPSVDGVFNTEAYNDGEVSLSHTSDPTLTRPGLAVIDNIDTLNHQPASSYGYGHDHGSNTQWLDSILSDHG